MPPKEPVPPIYALTVMHILLPVSHVPQAADVREHYNTAFNLAGAYTTYSKVSRFCIQVGLTVGRICYQSVAAQCGLAHASSVGFTLPLSSSPSPSSCSLSSPQLIASPPSTPRFGHSIAARATPPITILPAPCKIHHHTSGRPGRVRLRHRRLTPDTTFLPHAAPPPYLCTPPSTTTLQAILDECANFRPPKAGNRKRSAAALDDASVPRMAALLLPVAPARGFG